MLELPQTVPESHESPGQQGWPAMPQVAQTPAPPPVQTVDAAVQARPVQQG